MRVKESKVNSKEERKEKDTEKYINQVFLQLGKLRSIQIIDKQLQV